MPVQGDVLCLALEDGLRRLQRRLDKLLPTFSGEWPERLTLVAMGGWPRSDQGGLDEIETWCRSKPKPVLVVVDTLQRFRKPASGKDSSTAPTMRQLLACRKSPPTLVSRLSCSTMIENPRPMMLSTPLVVRLVLPALRIRS